MYKLRYMKKSIPFLFLTFAFLTLSNAQAKRYIWLEHFTNTNCGSCAASNPGFFNLIKNYKDQYHHLSVHPRIPYPQCILYKANEAEQTTRAAYYSISGTPTVMVQGTIKKSANTVTAAILDAEKIKTSAISVIVTETGTTLRTASVKVNTVGTKPGSNYRLFAAIAERQLDLATPNGEKVHHNVFRKFVSNVNGDIINLADQGGFVSLTFNYNVEANWKESETYLMVWVQDALTKEVLNSGNKFDLISGLTDKWTDTDFNIYPNPVADMLNVQLEKPNPGLLRLYITNVMGKVVYSTELRTGSSKFSFPVSNYQKGIYFVRLEQGKTKLAKKWLKS